MAYLHNLINEVFTVLLELQVFTDEETDELNQSIKLQFLFKHV